MSKAWVYILKCADGKYYTGSTTNLSIRLAEHRAKKYKGFTSYRLPIELVYSAEFNSYHEAFQIERQIKKWSRAKKEALIKNDYDELHKLAECKNVTHYSNRTK
ncbi:MAG: GIY-YIG nuclease family protein [Bacteroidota bacterium]